MEVTNSPASQSRHIPVSQVKEGFNYRRRYNPEKMASLRESIKSQGLIQPVVVRQLAEDSFQLIAGGRRFKAVVAEFGPEATIKAEVKVMTDAEATAAMLAENNEREDPSVIEDAEGASRMLGLCKGDREEAARRLGWSRNKLDRRLAVMNATQEVRDAYLDDKILVGHVEILAALRKEVQERVIAALLKADRKVTVEELKAMADVSLQSLDAAIFDRVRLLPVQHGHAASHVRDLVQRLALHEQGVLSGQDRGRASSPCQVVDRDLPGRAHRAPGRERDAGAPASRWFEGRR
jgi:ParB family transcriptional regulator, chromosome partitioning protein